MGLKKAVQGQRKNYPAQYAAQGCGQGSWNPAHLKAHKGGGINGQRPWCHLGNGDNVRKHFSADPVVLIYHLFLDEGNNCIPAADAQ